jgi:hypothetical protein
MTGQGTLSTIHDPAFGSSFRIPLRTGIVLRL